MSASATVRLIDVLLIVFGHQWSSVAQRRAICQAVIHTTVLQGWFPQQNADGIFQLDFELLQKIICMANAIL